MTSLLRIGRESLPDHDGTPIDIYADGNGFDHIGTLTIEKGISRLDYAPGQAPHRAYPLKKKHRAR